MYMQMATNWIRMKLHQPNKTELALPEGFEKSVADDDAFFEVIGTGPDCLYVLLGQIIAVNPIRGVIRIRVPGEDFASFAIQETELIGILK